jgi:serine/threonine protein kinase
VPAAPSHASTFGAFAPEVGSVPFPGYRLLRLRGRGGFATVWEASTPSGQLMALKFMSSTTTAQTAREIRSLQSIRALDHEGLLKIRQVWSIPGTIVIGMDLADASLMDLLEVYLDELGRPVDVPKIAAHFWEVAQALDFLNARRHRVDGRLVGLQHGDIKPNNILLLKDKALLADYGLATPTNGTLTPCPRHGTAEYTAPEVFQGTLSERSDQFSLAVSYYVMTTGTFPYPEPPRDREKLKGYARPDPDLSRVNAKERAALTRALSPIPQERFPSCTDLINALLAAHRLGCDRGQNGETVVVPLSVNGSPSTSCLFLGN